MSEFEELKAMRFKDSKQPDIIWVAISAAIVFMLWVALCLNFQ